MVTHSSILAWEIPWTEEPGRLQSMGLQRVGHDLANIQQHLSKKDIQFSPVQLLNRVQLFATPWTAVHQASLSINNSRSLLKLSSSIIPFSSCPQFSPASGSFPMSWFFASGGQSIRTSASASVLPVNIQD